MASRTAIGFSVAMPWECHSAMAMTWQVHDIHGLLRVRPAKKFRGISWQCRGTAFHGVAMYGIYLVFSCHWPWRHAPPWAPTASSHGNAMAAPRAMALAWYCDMGFHGTGRQYNVMKPDGSPIKRIFCFIYPICCSCC